MNQWLLLKRLRELFPHERIQNAANLDVTLIPLETVVNSRKQSKMRYSEHDLHSRYLELDIWFPKRDLCFEFQVTF